MHDVHMSAQIGLCMLYDMYNNRTVHSSQQVLISAGKKEETGKTSCT